MSAVEMEMTSRLGKPEEASKFSRQHLANSLWALATLERLPPGRLLTALAAAMQERASACNPQEISNTVWAFAKLGQPCFTSSLCLGFALFLGCFCSSALRNKRKLLGVKLCCCCWHLLLDQLLLLCCWLALSLPLCGQCSINLGAVSTFQACSAG